MLLRGVCPCLTAWSTPSAPWAPAAGIRADSIALLLPVYPGGHHRFHDPLRHQLQPLLSAVAAPVAGSPRSDELGPIGTGSRGHRRYHLDLRGVLRRSGHSCLPAGGVPGQLRLTTTGYATADFDLWPGLSRAILFALLFIGGCAGSTAGGLKVSRAMILLRTIRREVNRLVHPRRVTAVRCDGKAPEQRGPAGRQHLLRPVLSVHLITFLCLSGSLLPGDQPVGGGVLLQQRGSGPPGAVGPCRKLRRVFRPVQAAAVGGHADGAAGDPVPCWWPLSPSVWRKD